MFWSNQTANFPGIRKPVCTPGGFEFFWSNFRETLGQSCHPGKVQTPYSCLSFPQDEDPQKTDGKTGSFFSSP